MKLSEMQPKLHELQVGICYKLINNYIFIINNNNDNRN